MVFLSPVSHDTAGRAAGVLQEYHLHRLLHQVCSESGPVQAVPVKASLHFYGNPVMNIDLSAAVGVPGIDIPVLEFGSLVLSDNFLMP